MHSLLQVRFVKEKVLLVFSGILLLIATSANSQDVWEPDNTYLAASNLLAGTAQTDRTLHDQADIDFVSFSVISGHVYSVGISNTIYDTDIVLSLLDTNGTTLLAAATNGFTSPDVSLIHRAGTSGVYFSSAAFANPFGTMAGYTFYLVDYGSGDAYETDDTFLSASNMTAGVIQTGKTIHWLQDIDYTTFIAQSGHLYRIAITNSTITETLLQLYDTNGTTVLVSDSELFGFGNGVSMIDYLFESNGTYAVSFGTSGLETGSYEIVVEDLGIIPGDAFESDNSHVSASTMTVGTTQTLHTIHWSGDLDYASFFVQAGHNYMIAITNVAAALDVMLDLYDFTGTNLLTSADSGAGGDMESVTWVALASSNWYARASSFSGTGNFDIAVYDIASLPADIYEADDAYTSASNITVDVSQTNRTIHATNDVDFVRFTALPERYYMIQTSDPDWGLDTMLSLYDETGTNLLAANDNGGTWPSSLIQYRVSTGGTFYVKVEASGSGSIGSYTLKISDTRICRFWSLGGQVPSSPSIGVDGTIYAGCTDGSVYGLSSDGTATQRWRTVGSVRGSPAIDTNGNIYVGCRSNRVYSFGPGGMTNWATNTSLAKIDAGPAIGPDGTVYVCTFDYRMHALNATNGTTKWTFSTFGGFGLFGSPAVGPDGTICFGSDNGIFYAVHPDGAVAWTNRVLGQIHNSPAIGADGTIYIGDTSNRVYAFSPQGATNHVWNAGGMIDSSSPVLDADGTLYIGTLAQTVSSMKYDGTTNFVISVPGHIFNSSAAVGSDGTVYIGSLNSGFFAFDRNGSIQFMITLNGGISSSPVIDTNGMIYVGTDNNRLYSIYGTSAPTQGLAASAWPILLQNVRRTGHFPGRDTDADGLDDMWEQFHFRTLSRDGTGDADNDAIIDIDEYLRGSDPGTNSDARSFQLNVSFAGTNLEISLSTIKAEGPGYPGLNRYYRLENQTNLLATNSWTGIEGITNIPATGGSVVYTNPPESNLFFRARTWLE